MFLILKNYELGNVLKRFQPRVVRRSETTSSCRWNRTQTSTGSKILRGEEKRIIIYNTLSESPHSARGPVFKLFSTFYSLNVNADWHTRGGRGGKRGYSLRLFAYTGRFRLGSLCSIFFLFFWEILNTDREQCFPNIGCICQLSPLFHRSRLPG